MLPRWKTQFFIKFFEGGIIMQEGNRGQPKEDPFHVFVPLLPLNMAQNDISDSPIPSWNVPGPWNYPETAVSRQLLLTTALWNYAKSAPKFLNMGLTPPPPFWTMFKKTAELVTGGTPYCDYRSNPNLVNCPRCREEITGRAIDTEELLRFDFSHNLSKAKALWLQCLFATSSF